MQPLRIPQWIYDKIESIVRQFIWGLARGSKKITPISWNSVCQPKAYGKLEIRQLKDQNTSFLLNLGFNILTNLEALWVWVLCSKYGIKYELPFSISRSNYSFLWRALLKVLSLLRENIFRSVGDGNTIRCWRDRWIPKIGPLINLIPANANIATNCCLKETVTEKGLWNLKLFRVWLLKD